MAQYPNIRIVPGDLDDSDLLERESAAADIVLRECGRRKEVSDCQLPDILSLQTLPMPLTMWGLQRQLWLAW